MTNRKLGEMSLDELEDEGDLNRRREVVAQEIIARDDCHWFGAPGKHAVLSREQVKAFLGPKLKSPSEEEVRRNPIVAAHFELFNNGVHACALALLNLPPDAKSPLEDGAEHTRNHR